jgi:hypothetical protein
MGSTTVTKPIHPEEAVLQQIEHPTTLLVETYRNGWKKTKEKISCHPGALSFSTRKAGAQSENISLVECIMTRIPIFAGFAPSHWKNDIMIQK